LVEIILYMFSYAGHIWDSFSKTPKNPLNTYLRKRYVFSYSDNLISRD